MDLNQVIDNIRKCAMELETLEVPDRYEDCSFSLLMAEIKKESRQLSENFEDKVRIGAVNAISSERVIFKENNLHNASARHTDDKLSRFWLYRRFRPIVKRFYRRMHPYRTVDGKKLTSYDGECFIRTAYKSILLREAEESAVSNMIVLLEKKYVSKEEFLYSLMNSDEGRNIGIKVVGIKKEYRKKRLRHCLMRIPVIGRYLRRRERELRVVSGKQLMRFNGEAFVRKAYCEILCREADAPALVNAVTALQRRDIYKEELIYALVNSPEGMRQDILITGIRGRYYLKRIERWFFRIPFFGWILHWAEAVVFLVRRLSYMEHSVSDCMNYLYSLNQEFSDLKNQVGGLESHSDEQERKLGILQEYFREQEEAIISLRSQAKDQKEAFERGLKDIVLRTEKCGEEIGSLGYQLGILREYSEEKEREFGILQGHSEEQEKELSILQEHSRKQERELGILQERSGKQEEILGRLKDQAEEQEQELKREEENCCKKIRLMDEIYLHYNEKLMPDSRESVKEAMRVYLPYIEKRVSARKKETLQILDVGCGEGEWLELLTEQGYQPMGIDSNQAVVEKALKQHPQLNIMKEDAMDYLHEAEDGALDIISCIHVVEHMGFLELIEFLRECFRVLKQDGMLLLETPNPYNILTSTYYFYLDPTHRNPIPQELLRFFVEESGFTVEDVLWLKPLDFVPYSYDNTEDKIKDIIFRFNMEQAYSIVAVKG